MPAAKLPAAVPPRKKLDLCGKETTSALAFKEYVGVPDHLKPTTRYRNRRDDD